MSGHLLSGFGTQGLSGEAFSEEMRSLHVSWWKSLPSRA